MDIIFLSEVKVKTRLGVPEWERILNQNIILDIEIGLPSSKSCQSDDIKDTINYADVVFRIRELLAKNSFQLVEYLAEQVCQLIMTEFGAPWVRLKVSKPGILPGLKALGVIIERGEIVSS